MHYSTLALGGFLYHDRQHEFLIIIAFLSKEYCIAVSFLQINIFISQEILVSLEGKKTFMYLEKLIFEEMFRIYLKSQKL